MKSPGAPIIQMMVPPRQAITVPLAGIQVLVVDDSAPIRNLLVTFFVKRKMAVVAAADGRSAIQTLERNPGRFGLVVTDLNMPGADGFAVLMEAKRSNPACAVVIVTGYATLDSAIQAVRVGAFDYLPKPFSLSDVERLLMRIATDRAWADPPPDPPEADSVEVLKARVRELESRLASLGVQLNDGIPTLY